MNLKKITVGQALPDNVKRNRVTKAAIFDIEPLNYIINLWLRF